MTNFIEAVNLSRFSNLRKIMVKYFLPPIKRDRNCRNQCHIKYRNKKNGDLWYVHLVSKMCYQRVCNMRIIRDHEFIAVIMKPIGGQLRLPSVGKFINIPYHLNNLYSSTPCEEIFVLDFHRNRHIEACWSLMWL